MNKILLVAAAIGTALLLAGCDPTEDEKLKLKGSLPADCEVINIGTYGDIKELVIVKCKSSNATVANGTWKSGKSTHQFTSVTLS